MSVKVRIKKGKSGDLLYLDTIRNRKHHWESLHITLSKNPVEKKEQLRFAESCRAQRELQIAQREWGFIDTVSGKMLFSAYFKKVMETKNASTRKVYKQVLDNLQEYKDIKISQIDLNWIEGLKDFLEKNMARTTARMRLTVVKGVVNNAVKEGILNKNPCSGLRLAKVQGKEKEPLTFEEVARLAKIAFSGTDRARENKRAFLFACYTGLRYSDLATLTYSNIEHRAINNGNSFAIWIKKEQVKTKNLVEIPLLPMAKDLLDFTTLHSPNDLVFPFVADCGNITRVFNEWARMANVSKHITWHIARHTFATLASELGLEPIAIQRILGHTRLDTTAIYAKTTDKAKCKGMEIFSNYLQSVNA